MGSVKPRGLNTSVPLKASLVVGQKKTENASSWHGFRTTSIFALPSLPPYSQI